MGDQARQTQLKALPEQPPSAIQSVEAGVNDARGVADVMQPASSSE